MYALPSLLTKRRSDSQQMSVMQRQSERRAQWDRLGGLGVKQMLSNCQMKPCHFDEYLKWDLSDNDMGKKYVVKHVKCLIILSRDVSVHNLLKTIYKQQIICVLADGVWHAGHKCKAADSLVSFQDTAAHASPVAQMFLRPIIIPSLPVYRSLSSKFFQRGCVSAVFSYDSTSHMLTITNMYTLACICTDT